MRPGPARRVAILLGDPAGIGPEIALTAALDPRVTHACRPLLVGDARALAPPAASFDRYRSAAAVDWRGDGVKLLALEPTEAARTALEAARDGHVDAVVAAPQSEGAGLVFGDDAALVASCTGIAAEDAYLMLCFDGGRIVRLTPRCALAHAVALVTRQRVQRAIEETHQALQRLGIAAPRIAVAGLNPHAGEGGLFGDEELRTIGPAIAAAQAKAILAEGPFGADTMFHRHGVDAFIVMYHDQAEVAAQILAGTGGTAITIGAPVLYAAVAGGSEALIAAVQLVAGAARRQAA